MKFASFPLIVALLASSLPTVVHADPGYAISAVIPSGASWVPSCQGATGDQSSIPITRESDAYLEHAYSFKTMQSLFPTIQQDTSYYLIQSQSGSGLAIQYDQAGHLTIVSAMPSQAAVLCGPATPVKSYGISSGLTGTGSGWEGTCTADYAGTSYITTGTESYIAYSGSFATMSKLYPGIAKNTVYLIANGSTPGTGSGLGLQYTSAGTKQEITQPTSGTYKVLCAPKNAFILPSESPSATPTTSAPTAAPVTSAPTATPKTKDATGSATSTAGKGVKGVSNTGSGGGKGSKSAIAKGDPHFKTFGGEQFDFHGGCDLVFLQHAGFSNGLGMDIHIRTKINTWWSYIHTAVVRIGEVTLEITGGNDGGKYWVNGVSKKSLDSFMISGCMVKITQVSSKQRKYRIELGHGNAIAIETYKDFVSTNVKVDTGSEFMGSHGLMGAYPDGRKVARDGMTIMEDSIAYGQEWQVLNTEEMLFHNWEGPQHPMACAMPDTTEASASRKKRRLGEGAISKADAEAACAHAVPEDKKSCIFDVLATQDGAMADQYY